ncbi:MAG: hypothetical protein KBC42_03745 [Candidatus Pacebacteria bacterium]|nr:hypothetical protein [Candidatus Paceibacterota bacterium]
MINSLSSTRDQSASVSDSQIAVKSQNLIDSSKEIATSTAMKEFEEKIVSDQITRLNSVKIVSKPATANVNQAQDDISKNGNPNKLSVNPVIYAPFPNLITVTDNVNTVDYKVLINVFSGTSDFVFTPYSFQRSDVMLPQIPWKRNGSSASKYGTTLELRSTAGWGPYFNSVSTSTNIINNNNTFTVPANQVGTIEFTYNIPKDQLFSGIHSFKIDTLQDSSSSPAVYLPVLNMPDRALHVDGINKTAIFASLAGNNYFTPILTQDDNSLVGLGFGRSNKVVINYSNGTCTTINGVATNLAGINDGPLQRLELGNNLISGLQMNQPCYLNMDITTQNITKNISLIVVPQ